MKKWYLACFSACLLSTLLAIADDARLVTIKHLTNASSYFQVNVQDSGLLKGAYPGWCADWATLIQDDTIYTAKVYSSYSDSLPAGLVDKPEHLDEVNWLINQHVVGETSEAGGNFTSGDLQVAIWTLIDDHFSTSTVGPFSQARVDELVAMALEEGADFKPNCKQYEGIILEPGNEEGRVQTTIIEVPTRKFPKCVFPAGEEGIF